MRWIVDTSAWARRDVPEVRAQLAKILAESDAVEFVLSPPVLLELMRGPQGDAVARERERLTAVMETLVVDKRTFELAAGAMERLALVGPEAHRLPVPDLITAALAHQHDCGIVHLDGDFELLAQHSGLSFAMRRVATPGERSKAREGHPVASRQRALKQELSGLLHRMPPGDAEAILDDIVRKLKERGGR